MAKSKIHVGLEIGTSKVCMVVGEVKPNGSVTILGVGEASSAGVRKGEITEFRQVRTCVKTATHDAEDKCDVEINSVILAVTGSHVEGENNRGMFRLPEGVNQVEDEHIEEVELMARDVIIPASNLFLHDLIKGYLLNGQPHQTKPIGLFGDTLEADFHVIHGDGNRIQNSVKCVRETPLDVELVVFAPIASAQVALERKDKEAGALVIDIGGGTTDYVLYLNGGVEASGCVPIGGDHVTNDIHLVVDVSWSKAEQLKKIEGDVSGDPARSVGVVTVSDDSLFVEKEVERELLNEVMRGRLIEAFDLVMARLPEGALQKIGTGVFLTGGTSLTQGIGELAKEVFGLSVYHSDKGDIGGGQSYYKDPRYSTAVGLIRYAQVRQEEVSSKNAHNSLWRKITKLLGF